MSDELLDLNEIEPLTVEIPAEPPKLRADGRMVAGLRIPRGCSDRIFRNIVSAAYTAWIAAKGGLPTVDTMHYYYPEVTKRKISEVMITDEFVEAVEARGIPWRSKGNAGITASQQYAISILTDPSLKSKDLRTKLRMAGVTYPQYRAWLKQPIFARHLNELTEGMLSDHVGDLHTVLMNRALNGDLNAIKYVHELSGRHDPNQKAIVDAAKIVELIIEVVTRNVTDPQLLMKIQAEFQMVLSGKAGTIQGEISA